MATHGNRSALDTDDAALSFGASARRRSPVRPGPPVQVPPLSPRAVQPPAVVERQPDPVAPEGRSVRVILGLALVACVPALAAAWLLAPRLDSTMLASLMPQRDDKSIVMVAPGQPPAAPVGPMSENRTGSRDSTAAQPVVPLAWAAPQPQEDGAILAQLQSLRADIEQLRGEAARRRAEAQNSTPAPPPEAPSVVASPPVDTAPLQVPVAPPVAAPPQVAAAPPVAASAQPAAPQQAVPAPDSPPVQEAAPVHDAAPVQGAAPVRQADPSAVATREAAPSAAVRGCGGLRVLPDGAQPRVQVRFARNSDVARQRATRLVEVLRRTGAVVVDARESSGEPVPRVVYFYAADKDEAVRMAALVSSAAPVRRAVVDSGLLPRPGSIEVSVGNR